LNPLILHDPSLALILLQYFLIFSINCPHFGLLIRIQYYLKRLLVHFKTLEESINYLVHSFWSGIASHRIHPDEVLLFAVPNILSLCILACLCFEIVEEEVECFRVLCPNRGLLAVVEMYEVVWVGL
jgi:hypothetical protein